MDVRKKNKKSYVEQLAQAKTEEWENILSEASAIHRLYNEILHFDVTLFYEEKGYNAGALIADKVENKLKEKLKVTPEYFERAIPYLYCLADIYQKTRALQPEQKSTIGGWCAFIPVAAAQPYSKEVKIEGCGMIKSFLARDTYGSLEGDLKAFIKEMRPELYKVIYEVGSTLCLLANFVEAMCQAYKVAKELKGYYYGDQGNTPKARGV